MCCILERVGSHQQINDQMRRFSSMKSASKDDFSLEADEVRKLSRDFSVALPFVSSNAPKVTAAAGTARSRVGNNPLNKPALL